MAANEIEIPANKLKMQSIGKSRWPRPFDSDGFALDFEDVVACSARRPVEALQQYKTARENGGAQDMPKTPFPCAGFEVLRIKSSTKSLKGWPDGQGRYWWKLTLQDGSTNEEFAFQYDNIHGDLDKNDSDRYGFIVHGPNGIKMEGFSWEADRVKGFPDRSGYHWRYVQYSECGRIKEWMKEKDQNFCVRTGTFSFAVPFILPSAIKKSASPGLIPNSYCCPITQEIMLEPVIAMDGHTYEREAILQALYTSMLSPMTGQPMQNNMVIPNYNTRSMIQNFLTQHPECWDEVYVSAAAANELFALSQGGILADTKKWRGILRANPRLLTLSLKNVTLLELLCQQNESIVNAYLPALLNLLTPKNWHDLIKIYSAQDWLKLVAQTCERCAVPDLATEFLNKLQTGLGIKEINPLEMALYALEQKHLGLFKLALSQLKDVNVPIAENKNTLLHLAAGQGQTEMVQYLVNCGAHLKQRNAAGLKAEGIARLAGFEATADQIEVLKLTPVLERMGIFARLRRLEALEIKMQQMESSASSSSGYSKKI